MAPLDYVAPTAQAVREALAELTHPLTDFDSRLKAARRFRDMVDAMSPIRRLGYRDDIADWLQEAKTDELIGVTPSHDREGCVMALEAFNR